MEIWQPKYLTLEQRKNPLLKVGDRVLVTEPNAIQKRRYPACWDDGMNEWIGQVCIITSIIDNGVYVKLEETNWTWSECNLVPDTSHVNDFCLY